MDREEAKPGRRHAAELHGGGKAAQQRRGGRRRHILEHEALARLIQQQRAGAAQRRILPDQTRRQVGAIGAEQAHRHGDGQRPLLWLARRRRRLLRERQRIAPRRGVVGVAHRHLRRAGLVVPSHEGREVAPGAGFDGADEVLDRRGLVVVAGDVAVHAAPEGLRPHHGVQQPHHFRPLLIDGGGVEIIDFDIAVRAHGMRHGAGILGELGGAQRANIADALDRAAAHIGREFLVPEHRQPFFQGELEPVPAGDAVAGPVVEIFVRDDGLDPLPIGIGRGLGAGQDVFGVEDVEALILHGAHIEVGDGGDVEDIEIVFQAVDLLVPDHAALQAIHRMAAARLIARTDPDIERDRAAGLRGEVVMHMDQAAGDEGKEIARLGVRVVPARPMRAAFAMAATGGIAVREQHRAGLAIGPERHAEAGHDVRPVREEGDAAEALGLALRVVVAARGIEAGEFAIARRVDHHLGLQHTRCGRGGEAERTIGADRIGASRQGHAIDGDGTQRQPLAIEPEGAADRARRVATKAEPGTDQRRLRVQGEVELHRIDQKGRRRVVLPADGRGGLGHRAWS